MSRTKRALEEREQAKYDAAERDDRRCWACGSVVPYGTDLGPNEECPGCRTALGPVDKLIGPEAGGGDMYEAEIAC